MKFLSRRLFIFGLFPLFSLLGFFAKAAAQGGSVSPPSGSHNLPGKARNAHKGKIAPPTSGYSVLYSFCPAPGCKDGKYPAAGLIQDAAGNLYGTTTLGGSSGQGTVFELDNTGQETVLHSFCKGGEPCTDGEFPVAGLIQDAAGNLYGTTEIGGANNSGIVFKLDASGHETVLYSFCSVGGGTCTDGAGPHASVIQDTDGNLYGTTSGGGTNGGGTVFEIDSTDHETVLYSFCAGNGMCTDGNSPQAALIRDGAGNLYGTTTMGGSGGSAGGTVFEVNAAGQETVLHSFCSEPFCTDGSTPLSGLIRDAAGNLYGTTSLGGTADVANDGGTVFKVATSGEETVLYSFCSVGGENCTDGAQPEGGLIQDEDGNLYGTASEGGANGGGVVFEIDTAGQQTVLYNFCSAVNCTDGQQPAAGLIRDSEGNLYGTTATGGANGLGVVFKLATTGGGAGKATIALTSSPNPSYVDQSVTFSAVVSGSGATPTGSVTFEEGTTALGTVTLADGKTSLDATFAKKGTDSIIAKYSGDQNYNPANSKPLKQVVMQYATGTTLTSSLNPSTYGQAVTLTATVSSAGPTPTGTVTFKNGSATLGTASLSFGAATITTSTLAVGTLTITANYGGDAANEKSTSPALKQVVKEATSTTAVVSSENPSMVGKTVKFTATVTSPTTTPTGSVTFMDGNTTLGTETLAKGKASYSTSSLSAGAHNITAVYAGTADVGGSTSPVLVQTVN